MVVSIIQTTVWDSRQRMLGKRRVASILTHYIEGKSYEEASTETVRKNAFNQTCQPYSLVTNANQPFASRSTPSTLDTTLAFLDRDLFLCNCIARSSTTPSSRQICPSSSLVASQRLHGNTYFSSASLSFISILSRCQAGFNPLLSCQTLTLLILPIFIQLKEKISSYEPKPKKKSNNEQHGKILRFWGTGMGK